MGTSTYMKAASQPRSGQLIFSSTVHSEHILSPIISLAGLHTCEERPPVVVECTSLHQTALLVRIVPRAKRERHGMNPSLTSICSVTPRENVNASKARLCGQTDVSKAAAAENLSASARGRIRTLHSQESLSGGVHHVRAKERAARQIAVPTSKVLDTHLCLSRTFKTTSQHWCLIRGIAGCK